jgi:hypothetical protein
MGRVVPQTLEVLQKVLRIDPESLKDKSPEQVEAEVYGHLKKYLIRNESERDQTWAEVRSHVDVLMTLCGRFQPGQVPTNFQLTEQEVHALAGCLHLVRVEMTQRVMTGICSQMEGM